MKTGWIDEATYKKIRKKIPIPTVDLLITYKEKILLMKRNFEPAKGLWFTPGGRIYVREKMRDAAVRVLREETGLKPLTIEMKGVMEHIWPQYHSITIFFMIVASNDQVIMNDEHSEFKWVNNITEDLHPYLKYMIKKSDIFN